MSFGRLGSLGAGFGKMGSSGNRTRTRKILRANGIDIQATLPAITLAGDFHIEMDVATADTGNQVLMGDNYQTSYYFNLNNENISVWIANTTYNWAHSGLVLNGDQHTIKYILTGTSLEVFIGETSLGAKAVTPYAGVNNFRLFNTITNVAFFDGYMSGVRIFDLHTPSNSLAYALDSGSTTTETPILGTGDLTYIDVGDSDWDVYEYTYSPDAWTSIDELTVIDIGAASVYIDVVATDDVVDETEMANVSISGFTGGIGDGESINVTATDGAQNYSGSATVSRGMWSVVADLTAFSEGSITITAERALDTDTDDSRVITKAFSDATLFSVSGAALNRVTLDSSNYDWSSVENADCSDLVATQNSQTLAVYVRPDASLSGESAIVYVRSIAAGNIQLLGGGPATLDTSLPSNMPFSYTEATISLSHSGASTDNPLTSHTHPCVVCIPAGWNGYKYWGVVTPWDGSGWPSANRYEDPCIINSANGLSWSEVDVNGSGYANIYDAYSVSASSFSSDSCLMFDAAGNGGAGVLYCYWRVNDSSSEDIFRMETTDGETWTDSNATSGAHDTLSISTTLTLSGTDNLLSPSVIKKGATSYEMFVTCLEAGALRVRHFTSTDGLTFSGGEYVANSWPNAFKGPWHTEVRYDDVASKYIMTLIMARSGSTSTTGGSASLFLAISDDGQAWELEPFPVVGITTLTLDQQTYKSGIFKSETGKWRISARLLRTNG